MPILEYHCAACGRVFEELVRSSAEKTRVTCPDCDSRRVSRQLSVFSARGSRGSAAVTSPPGGCGRCGDPDGPCAL